MAANGSRFLFITWDGGGNIPPELAIARRLVARGHGVRFLCDPTLEAEVCAAGCEMTPWTTAPHRRAATAAMTSSVTKDPAKEARRRSPEGLGLS